MVPILAACLLLGAQLPSPGPAESAKPRAGQSVRSPEVAADGSVTLRLRCPNAGKVTLTCDGVPNTPLRKDSKGVWSVTIGPLAPDYYSYLFMVDGEGIADPANELSVKVVTGGSQSIIHVPGPQSLPWEASDLPHGTIHALTYRSDLFHEQREFDVYTPPGYERNTRDSYPTLYLLHGVMEDCTAWATIGRVGPILDHLIASGLARPMVVVMPLGYGFSNCADNMSIQFGGLRDQRTALQGFERSLLREVVPRVEADFRVVRNRESRAIAGLSLGGAQALSIGLRHPEAFSYVGSFSGAFIIYGSDTTGWLPKSIDAGTKLVEIDCGEQDFLLNVNRKVAATLEGVPRSGSSLSFAATSTPGAHTWLVWRRDLVRFAPKLFR